MGSGSHWSRSKNDDLRNGMALCKLCHWTFDEGMMWVSDNHEVITARQIAADPNVPGLLLTLTGRGIIGPQERELWPARRTSAGLEIVDSFNCILEMS